MGRFRAQVFRFGVSFFFQCRISDCFLSGLLNDSCIFFVQKQIKTLRFIQSQNVFFFFSFRVGFISDRVQLAVVTRYRTCGGVVHHRFCVNLSACFVGESIIDV